MDISWQDDLVSVNPLPVRSKYSYSFPLERCKLLTRWAFEYFDQTTTRRGKLELT